MKFPIASHCGTYSASANRYTPIQSFFFATLTATENTVSQPMAGNGILRDMYIDLKTTSPGAGKSITFTVYKNGVATSLQVVIADAATNGSDTTESHAVLFTLGDKLSLEMAPSGTPTTSDVLFGFSCEQQTGQSCLTGDIASGSATVSSYASLQGNGFGLIAPTLGTLIPTSGVFDRAFGVLSAAPGSGKTRTLVLVKNGVDTALTFQIIDGSISGSIVNTPVSVAAGDEVYWRQDVAGTPASASTRVGTRFVPDIEGESIQSYSSWTTNYIATGANYVGIGSSSNAGGVGSSVENNRVSSIGLAVVVKKLYAKVSTAPSGATKSVTVKVRVNNADAGSISAAIVDTATTANDTSNTANASAGHRFGFGYTGANTPTVGVISMSCVTYVDPGYKAQTIMV